MTKFDLTERTSAFGEKVVDFAKIIPRNPITFSLISQFIRAGCQREIKMSWYLGK